ncbi:gamma-glutamylcyclotransferase [Vreelandella rituensis]|uniref:Gamma-glutamylcyclotransferase n=1 Tax=Vreelandella rituensis TaxID=2282306 RepID=A0A368U5H7_9GAMM|nr:gamma-glutamylcyclotransferase [Halomonas rituensis]
MSTAEDAVKVTSQVAVYGTLKRGLRNDRWLGEARFVGTDRLIDITLYDLGPFPGAKQEASQGVEVEIFNVTADQMARLDQLEGFNTETPTAGLYDRVIFQTRHGPAWLYLFDILPHLQR